MSEEFLLKDVVGKVYLPNGKEITIISSPLSDSIIRVKNCNGITVLKITFMNYKLKSYIYREFEYIGSEDYYIIGNFALITKQKIEIENCDKKESEAKNE